MYNLRMKLCGTSKLLFLLFITFLLIFVASTTIFFWAWIHAIKYSSEALDKSSKETQTLISQVVNAQAELFAILSTSASNLATIFATLVEESHYSFQTIQKKVVPTLSVAYSTVPYVSQTLFIGNNGMLFSFYKDLNQTRAIFSNSSWYENKLNHLSRYHWYGGPVDTLTGTFLGDQQVDLSDLLPFHLDWMKKALGYRGTFVLIESSLADDEKLYLLFTASIVWNSSSHHNMGTISLGVSMDEFMNYCTRSIYYNNVSIYLATKDGKILAQTGLYFPNSRHVDNLVLQEAQHCSNEVNVHLDMNGKFYTIHCTPINVTGNPLVFITLLPHKDIMHHIHEIGLPTLIVLAMMLIMIGLVNVYFYYSSRRYKKTTSFLHAALIKCKEDIQQAERKSMNKSLAFASATHDIRTSLACIIGLIRLCNSLIPMESNLEKYLKQMHACASKLSGIVNSVLDISKVEAGKMQLEDVSFDMIEVLEESVDIFRIIALKKGLELVWDPCDFSIFQHSSVEGDCQRLKQILDNLLGNAMKFTPKGHVILRAWAKKASPQISTSNYGCQISNIWKPFLGSFHENDHILGKSCSPHHVPNCIEFIFELEDSGIGIPMEKRDFVFENYVQVKGSTSGGYEMGTGLGLGIVQSFVRLMGGEIKILDKDMNETGTCFRFNIFLKPKELSLIIETDKSHLYNQLFDMLYNLNVLHFIQGAKMRKILERWLGSFGAKVWETDTIEGFDFSSDKIKNGHTLNPNREGAQGSTPTKDGVEHNFFLKRTSWSKPLLIIIDMSYPCLPELLSIINNFVKAIDKNHYKIVFLRDDSLDELILTDMKVQCDLILDKPLHGSRINKLLTLVQEFKSNPWVQNKTSSMGLLPYDRFHGGSISSNLSTDDRPLTGWNILVVEDNHILRHLALKMISKLGANVGYAENGEIALNIIREALKESFLAGKDEVDKIEEGTSYRGFLYDIILMDCEMPKMNGYEAARQIRIEEKQHGIHIPIIALSAHEPGEKGVKSIEAGMDFHVMKPLTKELLLDVIQRTNIAKNK